MAKKNLKVAFILGGEFPETIGSFRLDQIIALLNAGVDVQIFVIRKPKGPLQSKQYAEELKKNGIWPRIHDLHIPKGKFSRYLKAASLILGSGKNMFKLLSAFNKSKYKSHTFSLNHLFFGNHFLNSKEEFDVIHCHGGQRGIVGSYLKDIGIKGSLVTTFYGSDVNKYPKTHGLDCYDNIFKTHDKLVPVVEFLKKKLVKMGCEPNKIEPFPYNLRVEEFEKPKARKSKGPIKIISVGRLIGEKGMDYGIRAVSELVKKGHKIEYTVIGEGGERPKLEKLIKDLKMEGVVNLAGSKPKSEVIKQYQKSDIFIMPATIAEDGTEEAQGTVLQESQLCMLPVVASRIGGIPEGIIDGKTGFLTEQKSVPQLVEKIEFLIKNPTKRKKMGADGREFVKKKYSTQVFINNITKLYQSTLK